MYMTHEGGIHVTWDTYSYTRVTRDGTCRKSTYITPDLDIPIVDLSSAARVDGRVEPPARPCPSTLGPRLHTRGRRRRAWAADAGTARRQRGFRRHGERSQLGLEAAAPPVAPDCTRNPTTPPLPKFIDCSKLGPEEAEGAVAPPDAAATQDDGGAEPPAAAPPRLSASWRWRLCLAPRSFSSCAVSAVSSTMRPPPSTKTGLRERAKFVGVRRASTLQQGNGVGSSLGARTVPRTWSCSSPRSQ